MFMCSVCGKTRICNFGFVDPIDEEYYCGKCYVGLLKERWEKLVERIEKNDYS